MRARVSLSAMRLLIVRLLVAALALASAAAASTTRGARKTKPWTATGRVLDVKGRPVAGAALDVSITKQMFPYLGELRAELAAIVRAGTTEPRERRDGSCPADHAARLLAYWADPADDVLVVPWLKKNWGGRPAHVAHLGLSAASIHEVCDRWREIHFVDQGISTTNAPRRERARKAA
jgi:hypothetical protein